MALDIILSANRQVPEWNADASVSFGAGADYWFLWPTLIKEIKDATGELIDLYGDAEFFGDNLKKVERLIIKQIHELKNKKEDKWEVHTGTEFQPVKKEIYRTLVKKDLEDKLEKFLLIVRQAIEKDEKIICIGD